MRPAAHRSTLYLASVSENASLATPGWAPDANLTRIMTRIRMTVTRILTRILTGEKCHPGEKHVRKNVTVFQYILDGNLTGI